MTFFFQERKITVSKALVTSCLYWLEFNKIGRSWSEPDNVFWKLAALDMFESSNEHLQTKQANPALHEKQRFWSTCKWTLRSWATVWMNIEFSHDPKSKVNQMEWVVNTKSWQHNLKMITKRLGASWIFSPKFSSPMLPGCSSLSSSNMLLEIFGISKILGVL